MLPLRIMPGNQMASLFNSPVSKLSRSWERICYTCHLPPFPEWGEVLAPVSLIWAGLTFQYFALDIAITARYERRRFVLSFTPSLIQILLKNNFLLVQPLSTKACTFCFELQTCLLQKKISLFYLTANGSRRPLIIPSTVCCVPCAKLHQLCPMSLRP